MQSAGVLVKALQYVKSFDSVIIQLPDDKSINPNGLMNEELLLQEWACWSPKLLKKYLWPRDIKTRRLCSIKLHLTGISGGFDKTD